MTGGSILFSASGIVIRHNFLTIVVHLWWMKANCFFLPLVHWEDTPEGVLSSHVIHLTVLHHLPAFFCFQFVLEFSLFSCLVLLQPSIVALGPVSNVSSPIAVNAERPDRILPAVSTSVLVSSFCLYHPLLLFIM